MRCVGWICLVLAILCAQPVLGDQKPSALCGKVQIYTYDIPYRYYAFELRWNQSNEVFESSLVIGRTRGIGNIQNDPPLLRQHSASEGKLILSEIERLIETANVPSDTDHWGDSDIFRLYAPPNLDATFCSAMGNRYPGVLAFKKLLPSTFVGKEFLERGLLLEEGIPSE